MAYKKYIEKNGKRYGPYIYHSKRVDGKVVSEYQGVLKKKNYKTYFFAIFAVLFILGIFIFLANFNPTGNVTLLLENDYQQGQNLNGILNFALEQGEFIPASTKVVINNSGNLNEYFLSDLVKQNSSQGNYSVKGTSISGNGQGYGYKTIYPIVYFTLEVYSNKTNNTEGLESDLENNTIENKTQKPKSNSNILEDKTIEIDNTKENKTEKTNETKSDLKNNTIENITNKKTNEPENNSEIIKQKNKVKSDLENNETREIVEEEVIKDEEIEEEIIKDLEGEEESEVIEEPEVVEEPETSEESSDSDEEISLTGNVVAGIFKGVSNFFLSLTATGKAIVKFKEISGEVSKGKEFVYELQSGETAEIKPNSVGTNSKNLLGDDAVNLKIKENKVFVSTNYSENKKQDLNIDLEKLNLITQEGELEISFVYENETLAFLKKEINSKDLGKDAILEINQSLKINNSEFNETIVNQSDFQIENLTNEEKEILLKEFGNVSIQTIKSELFKDRFIIGYKLENFEVEFSYDSKEPKEILNSQIKSDKIKWLKDISVVLSQNESFPKEINNLVDNESNFF